MPELNHSFEVELYIAIELYFTTAVLYASHVRLSYRYRPLAHIDDKICSIGLPTIQQRARAWHVSSAAAGAWVYNEACSSRWTPALSFTSLCELCYAFKRHTPVCLLASAFQSQ